jgi:UDP-glucose 4-epimerase
MSDMASIVITGASGFLGRAVMARLTSLRLPHTSVSRRSEPGCHQVVDYRDTPTGDVLIHLAEEPDRAIVNSLDETYLDHSAAVVSALAKRAGALVYASSGAVYGDANDTPCSPDATVAPTDLYSRSKVHNEALVLAAGGTVLRLSNLFGPGMSPHNVIADIARQLPQTRALEVRDDKPVRDFLNVNAAVDAIVLLQQTPCPGILNIGSGIGLSIRELALLALHSVGQQGREIVVTQPTARRSVNILDITQTLRRLRWSPGPSPMVTLRDFFFNRTNLVK